MLAALNGSGDAPAPRKPSHPSYAARESKSYMQLAATTAKFVDTRPGAADKAKDEPALLIIEEDKPEREVKVNPSLQSQLGGVFEEESYPDVELPETSDGPGQGMYNAVDIVGGIGNDADRWKTVTMMLNNGESLDPKKTAKRKVNMSGGVVNPTLISPITGHKLGNYESNMVDVVVDGKTVKVTIAEAAEIEAERREKFEAERKLREAEEEANDTTDPLIKKLKKTLTQRGASGVLGLQKKFRLFDTDGSGTLDMKEFRRGMKEMKMNLSEAEMIELFGSFDTENSGQITYDAFIRRITGSMNVRRRKLVGMAFAVLDKDGDGLVTYEDIAAAYNVDQHPDFIAKKRTKKEILLEFLDGFDVGGTKDGIVTTDEFANYYTGISASIQSDDYFELMIRNAWHISGGEGWAANSANLRVLVTHSDGEQEVVEIKNDLGLDPKDKKAVVARLRAQGVDVLAIPGYTDAKGAALAMAKKAAQINNSATAAVKPAPGRLNGGAVAGLRGQVEAAQRDETALPLVEKFREALKSRGAMGFIGLQRAFRLMDEDGSGSLDFGELKRALKNINILLTEQQSKRLFDFFDSDKSGTISYEEFLSGVRGPINARRAALVDLAFSILDTDNSGEVEPSEIASKYNTSKHPDVVSGRKTQEAVLREFLETFDVGGEVDGKVTRQEFQNYYANVSSSIDNDDYFELMIRNAWHISGGTGSAANSANRRVLVTRADGSQSVEEIKNDLGLKADDKAGMMARLRAQGVDASNIDLYGGSDDKKSGAKPTAPPPRVNAGSALPPRPSSYLRPSASGGSLGGSNPSSRRPSDSSAAAAASRPAPVAVPTSAVEMIMPKLKEQLKAFGAHGFIGLQRKFRIMDDDGSGSLSLAELKKALNEMRVKLSDAEQRLLFDHFDVDKGGSIGFEEFLQGVRDPMSVRRLALVNQAFASLDTQGRGEVEAEDIAKSYTASKHPDVVSGRKTQEAVLREFLETFDVGGEVDGKVTRQEFQNYYANVSSSIDSDDYFELMIRNAWHISGGTGWSANSANRRVLVTRADGSQSVEEIKNDLGLKADDKAGMMARLRAQGVDVANIDLFGGEANKPKPASSVPLGPPLDENAASLLKKTALQQFSANDFSAAAATFTQLLGMYMLSRGPADPEVEKLEKSIVMAEKKAASQVAQLKGKKGGSVGGNV